MIRREEGTTHSVSSASSVVSFTRMWIIGRAKMRPATSRTHVDMNMFINLQVTSHHKQFRQRRTCTQWHLDSRKLDGVAAPYARGACRL